MIKEIKYGGITTTPSDYDSPDGDLASAVNLLQDGDRIVVPREIGQAPDTPTLSKKPLFIHNTTDNNTSYILLDGNNNLYYRIITDETPTDIEIEGAPQGEPKKIDAIGNTLIVLYDDGSIHYIVYSEGVYTDKGTHIPTVELQFGLWADNIAISEKNLASGITLPNDGSMYRFKIPDGYKDTVTKQLYGQLEELIHTHHDENGKFLYPFFVRYALRLYDGSYTNISAPVLMVCNIGYAPVFGFVPTNFSGSVTIPDHADMSATNVFAVFSQLKARLVSDTDILDGWEDVVKDIDVFISSPIQTFDILDDIGDVAYMQNVTDMWAFYNGGFVAYTEDVGGETGYNRFSYYQAMYNHTPASQNVLTFAPSYNNIEKEAETVSNFYLLHSYVLDETRANYGNEDLDGSFRTVPFDKKILPVLETQKTLPDDYYSNDTLLAKSAFTYNSRINLANISRSLFLGFSPAALLPPYDVETHSEDRIRYYVVIEENGIKTTVFSDESAVNIIPVSSNFRGIVPSVFFYPNPNATRLIVERTSGGNKTYYGFNLKPHPTLNGAYIYFADDDLVGNGSSERPSDVPLSLNDYTPSPITYPSQIYTSEAYNPYVFKAENINQLPISADIINIASTTQPMSQGQFGQYPLYVFSDEGIFALQLASNGSFSSLTPVTRDVILGDGSSLTQLDDSLLFATKQGIMELVGKNTKCITKDLDKKIAMPILGSIGEITCDEEVPPIVPVPDIKTFINGCKMVYDYVNARVIVFNPEYKLAYVYAAKDDAWTMMPVAGLIDTINAYPEAYAVAAAQKGSAVVYGILDLSTITDPQREGSIPPYGWLITRPFSLDSPNDFKFIDVIRQNGVFKEYLIKDGDEYNGKDKITEGSNVIRQILYGSNDLIHWFIVGSSDSRLLNGRTSSPFKWFRLAVGCTFKHGESLSSFTVSYRVKSDNPHLF